MGRVSQRFLVIKLADLGDALTATPALRALRSSFPNASIDALVTRTGAAVLSGLDSVDRLICFEKSAFDRFRPMRGPFTEALVLGLALRRTSYDRVFLLHHLFTRAGRIKYATLLAATGAPWRGGLAECRPSFLTDVVPDHGYGVCHEADYWLRVVGLAGATADGPRLEVHLTADDRRRARTLLAEIEPKQSTGPRVVLYPGGGAYSEARRWPAEHYVAVGKQLTRQIQGTLLVVGGPSECQLAEAICHGIGDTAHSLAGQTDVKTLAGVLESADILIGNDGGVLHLGVAVGLPTVAIFGPSNHVSWGPYRGELWPTQLSETRRSTVVRQDLPCAPCLYRGYLPGTRYGCRARDCLTLTKPDDVVQAALALLASGSRR